MGRTRTATWTELASGRSGGGGSDKEDGEEEGDDS